MQPTSYVRLLSQKVQRARRSWLSLVSPGTTAMSEEEEDDTKGEKEDKECSEEQVDKPHSTKEFLPTKIEKFSPYHTAVRPSPTRLSSPASIQLSSPSPARVSLGDISDMLARRHEEEKSHLQKQIDDLQRTIAEYEKNGHSAYMAPQHQLYHVQRPPHPMSRAMSPPPFGTFFPSPFGFYSHCMAALY